MGYRFLEYRFKNIGSNVRKIFIKNIITIKKYVRQDKIRQKLVSYIPVYWTIDVKMSYI